MSGLNQIKQELGLAAEMQDTTRGEEEICGTAHLICKADRTLTADCQQTERQGMKGKFQVIRMQVVNIQQASVQSHRQPGSHAQSYVKFPLVSPVFDFHFHLTTPPLPGCISSLANRPSTGSPLLPGYSS